MKFSRIKPGGVYYTVTHGRMGNTTIKTTTIHKVEVISVDAENERVIASWNGNSSKIYYQSQYSSWREKKPMLIKGLFGNCRLATREEIKKAKASSA